MTTQTLLITGASKGIGRALALKFSQTGRHVYAIGRDAKELKTLRAQSKQITPIVADLSTTEGRNAIVSALATETAISIIHNAGISKSSAFAELTEDNLRQHMETNFFAPILLTRALLLKLEGQRVLHISSGAALNGYAYKIPYCTSKGAMHQAIECLQNEYASQNFYFTNLRPGMVETAMQEALRNESVPTKDFYIQAQKQGQLIKPETVAEFVAWVMLKTDNETFAKTFWNIDDETHHQNWLPKGASLKGSA